MKYSVPNTHDSTGRTPLPGSGSHRAGLWTDSKLKKFWLVTFRGYTVSQTRSAPRSTMLGEVVFHTRWLLVPRR